MTTKQFLEKLTTKKWVLHEEQIREAESGDCPLISVARDEGVSVEHVGQFFRAAKGIGLRNPLRIACAADGDVLSGADAPAVAKMRSKLLKACRLED